MSPFWRVALPLDQSTVKCLGPFWGVALPLNQSTVGCLGAIARTKDVSLKRILDETPHTQRGSQARISAFKNSERKPSS